MSGHRHAKTLLTLLVSPSLIDPFRLNFLKIEIFPLLNNEEVLLQ